MVITNSQSGTNVHEIADRIYRINTPVVMEGGPGGFSFNQYLIVDDDPLIFHTGPRKMFPLVREAVASVMPVEAACVTWLFRMWRRTNAARSTNGSRSRHDPYPYAAQSRPWYPSTISPTGRRVPSRTGRGSRLGKHSVQWFDTPHLPHAWDCGFLMEERTRTLLCGDLFTQGGADHPPSPKRTFSAPARRSVGRWTITPTRKMGAGCLRDLRPPAHNPRMHARQRMARRRCETLAGSR